MRSLLILLVAAAALVSTVSAQCITPSFASGPTVETVLTDRVSVVLQLTSPGEVSCVVVPNGSPAPSDVQVQALQDSTNAFALSSAIQYARFPARLFHLSLASLAASTAYQVHCVAWDDTCLGTVSTVSATTAAVPPACIVNATAEPLAPTFEPRPETRIETGEFAGVEDDIFQTTFKASAQHQNISFTFTSGHTSYCDFDSFNPSASPLWTMVRGAGNCDLRFIARFNFTKALGECFTHTSTATQVLYEATVLATTNQIRPPIRGSPQTRTVKTAMRLRISLPLFVNVTTQVINVTGPPDFTSGNAVFLHELIEQVFDTNTYDTNLKLFTSLPYPYQLILANATLSTDPFYTLSDLRQFFTVGLSCGVSGTPCHQQWTMVLRPTAGQCQIDAVFNVTFMVTCSPSYPGRCPGYPRYITPVVYRLATNDFCLKIVSEGVATATILPYDSPAFATPAYNFIFNERVYFETNTQVAMALPLDHTSLVQLVVTSGNNRHELLLANDPRLHIFPVDSQFPGRLRFDFEVNSNVISLSNADSLQLVNVNATLAITYAGLNSAGPKYIHLSANVPAHQLMARDSFEMRLMDDTPSTSAFTFFFSKSAAITPEVPTTTTTQATSTGSTGTSTALIVGAAVGSLAGVVLIALVVYRAALRRAHKTHKGQHSSDLSVSTGSGDSVELSNTTNTTTTTTKIVFIPQTTDAVTTA